MSLAGQPRTPGDSSTARRVPVWAWFAAANLVFLLALCGVVALFAVRFQAAQQQQFADTEALRHELNAQSQRLGQAGTRQTHDAAATNSSAARSTSAEMPRHRLIADLVGSIVLITALDESGNEAGAGSGFVVDASGLVATNYHVLKGASSATAKFRNKTTCRIAGVRAFSPDADLVIVQLNEPPDALRPLELAGDEPPAPGSDVTAIGHPQGFEFSSTEGVVSAVHATSDLPPAYRRQIEAPADQIWVQTTAVIAGGSSGGPLLNGKGEVLGVNTWLAAGEKLGFAAHVKHLRSLLDNLSAEVIPLAEMSQPNAAFDKLVQAFWQDQAWYASRMETANSDEERQELSKTRSPAGKYANRFLELAESHRKTPQAFKALWMTCELSAYDHSDAAAEWLGRACERVLEDHAADPQLPQLVVLVSRTGHKSARAFLKRAAELNNRSAAGLACYLLATSLAEDSQSTAAERQQAALLFERILKDFRDLPVSGSTLGDLAKRELYVLENLSVGCQAPEIAGTDSADKEFKLSEYRGKVVLVDFWGNWCPHCVRMYPHERHLVEAYAGRPFVLLGVNDDDPETLRDLEESKQVTWRSWSDGRDGPISEQWGASGVPRLFLIDDAGKIRFKWEGYQGNEIDDEIEQVVKEAETRAAAAAAPAAP